MQLKKKKCFALDLMTLKEESQEKEDNVQHEKYDFMVGKKSFSCSHIEKAQKTANISYFTCQQCVALHLFSM